MVVEYKGSVAFMSRPGAVERPEASLVRWENSGRFVIPARSLWPGDMLIEYTKSRFLKLHHKYFIFCR